MLILVLACSNFILTEQCILNNITDNEGASVEGLVLKGDDSNPAQLGVPLSEDAQPSDSKPVLTGEFTKEPASLMKVTITTSNIKKVKLVIKTDDNETRSFVSRRIKPRITLFPKSLVTCFYLQCFPSFILYMPYTDFFNDTYTICHKANAKVLHLKGSPAF